MHSSPPDVRTATVVDLDPAAATLALAQHDSAWAMWACPHPNRFERLKASFALDLQIGLSGGSVWVSDDLACVAIWSPPTAATIDLELAARISTQQAVLIDPAPLSAADALTRPHHPSSPYRYLGTIGTLPTRRRSGLATAVLAPVLGDCDDDGLVACLETSSEDNVDFYTRLGFDEVFRTVTSDGVLPLIVMHRTPR